jgi:hypothetical protein
MKKQTLIVVALVAAAFGLGGYLLGGKAREPAATRTEATRGRSETTGAPLAEVGVAAAPSAAPGAGPAAAAPSAVAATGGARPTDLGSPAQRQRQLAILNESYRRETADPRWAPGAESTIELAAGPQGVGLKVLGVECHTLTCRAEIADSGPPQARDAKLEVLARRLGPILPSVLIERTEETPDGKKLVVLISRIPPM